MKVVSSAKLKTVIRNKLVNDFPELSFHFFKDIEEAMSDVLTTDILITYGEDLSEEIVKRTKNLKWIMVISAGLDQMPFRTIKEKGILVTNARGIHKVPMAEYTIAMMLQVSRNTKQLIKNEQTKVWDRRIPMNELHGKTIGVLGTGAIGAKVAEYAKVFNMKTIGFNRSGAKVDSFDEIVTLENLDYILNESDFVVSVLPSTPETDGLLHKQRFNQMKESSVLINIGRGKTIVESDLIEVLEDRVISHAVLDVFSVEPLPENHPFWEMDNVTVTPHLSGISPQYQPRAIEIFEENLRVFIEGRKNFINVIDLEKGY